MRVILLQVVCLTSKERTTPGVVGSSTTSWPEISAIIETPCIVSAFPVSQRKEGCHYPGGEPSAYCLWKATSAIQGPLLLHQTVWEPGEAV